MFTRSPVTPSSTISQRVQTNHGTVIGEYHAAPGAAPPPVDSIVAYLEQVAQTYDQEYKVAPDKRVWRGPFYARPVSQARGRRVDLVDLVDDLFTSDDTNLIRPVIVLLSDPGVGNTSALKYLSDRIAEQTLRSLKQQQEQGTEKDHLPPGSLIPLYIPLSELHPNQYFLTLVQAAFNRNAPKPINLDEAHMLLKEYDCLLLLDELEMVGNLENAQGLLLTRQFIDLYASEYFIFSCRESSYSNQLGQIETYRVDELSEGEVKDFLREELGEGLDDEDVDTLLTYGRNRSMLEIYLQRRKQGAGLSIDVPAGPKTRAHLLHEMIDQVLSAADSQAIGKELLEDILEQIGYGMQVNRTLRYSEEQLIEIIRWHLEAWGERHTTVRQVLHVFQQTGVMQREEQRLWRFHIRPTQAYFAAAAMAQQPEKAQVMLSDISSPWWRGPLEAFLGLTSDPNDLLFSIIDRDPLTAARSIRYAGRPINRTTINAIINALVEQMTYAPSEIRAESVRVMGRECLPPAPLFWHLLYHETSSNVLLAIARSLARRSHHSLGDTRRYKVNVMREDQVHEPLLEVMQIWRDCDRGGMEEKLCSAAEVRLLQILNSPIQYKESDRTIGVAAMALGAIGSQSAKNALVLQLMENHQSDFISWCIVDALTQIRYRDLARDVMRLYDGEIRQQVFAVYLLGWVGHRRGREADGQPAHTTLDILRNALTHETAQMRGYGAQSLGMLGLPQTVPLLEEILSMRCESELWVLRKMIKALGQVGSLNAIPILELYLWEESAVIRRRARAAIGEIECRFELA